MKFITVCILALCSLGSLGQQNLHPGYLINNEGDTIKGLVQYLNWEKNPKEIKFQENNGQLRTYGLSEFRKLGITGMDYYVRAVVSRSTRSVS